jgi:hypothetical protein
LIGGPARTPADVAGRDDGAVARRARGGRYWSAVLAPGNHSGGRLRYATVVGEDGLRRVVRLDGSPLGSAFGSEGAQERLAEQHAAAERERIGAELALRARYREERLRRGRSRRPIGSHPPSLRVPRLPGRPPGWRPADYGAFAKRLGVDGQAVREARRRARISQREIAGQLLVARGVVADAETGRRNVPPALGRWAAQVLRAG